MVPLRGTAPVVHAIATPTANAAGWRNRAVTVTFSDNDAVSGIASCTAPVMLATEGTNQSASGTCTDNAGLTGALATASGISIDLTPPTATVSVPAAGAVYTRGTTVLASFGCTDALSGVKSCSASAANGSALPTGTRGTKSFTVTATDVAGNSNKTTITYVVN